jgi:hypothetical protein
MKCLLLRRPVLTCLILGCMRGELHQPVITYPCEKHDRRPALRKRVPGISGVVLDTVAEVFRRAASGFGSSARRF